MKKNDDTDSLLPTSLNPPFSSVGTKSGSSGFINNGVIFKCYIVVMMTFIWTGYTVTVRYTRSTIPADKRYLSTTVVYLSEVLKLAVSLFCIFRIKNYSVYELTVCMRNDFIGKPLDLLKMSVPSVAYAIQNNLDFIALSNLDAGIYQVTTQLKVVTTALFMVIILGREFSNRRWMSIILLFCGVAAVQMSAVNRGSVPNKSENYLIGLIAVLTTCVTAGFAGVYFEMMLKDGTKVPFWIRNVQMYTCGVISSMFGCLFTEWDSIMSKGFFYGYNQLVIMIILFLSLGGIFISLVMKHLDNLHKSFASAVSIILVALTSHILFNDIHLNLYFLFGSLTVCGAILMYNSVSE